MTATFLGKKKYILLFLILGFLLYANALPNKMFWDDNDNVLNNQYIQNWKHIPKYFTENLIAGAGFASNYWRPVLLLIYSIEWHIWHSFASAYHLVNILLHIACVILLFFILFYLFKNKYLALFTALFFLAHPLQTEAVSYVAGLGDSLSSFFIFIGILFYIKFRFSNKSQWQSKFYYFSFLMYGLALMSKDTAVVMPGFLFLADLAIEKDFKKALKRIWPFVSLSLFYMLLRATVLNFDNSFNFYGQETAFTQSIYLRLLTFFKVLTIYFSLLFLPFNLHMERTVDIPSSFFSFSVVIGALIFFSLLIFALSQLLVGTRCKSSGNFGIGTVSFGILWFFIGLIPTSNVLIPVSGLLYEHWLYLPLIGIFLIFVYLLLKWKAEKIVFSIFIIYLIFFGILTIKRNREWRNPIVFYNQTLKYSPNSYRVVNNLGMAYADMGNQEEAEKTYQRAITIDSQNPVAFHNLANSYKAEGKMELAVENYNKAISLDPKFVYSYNALASYYLDKKDYKEARKVFESYLDYSPSKIDTLILLSNIAYEEKDYQGVLGYLKKAQELSPQNQDILKNIKYVEQIIKEAGDN